MNISPAYISAGVALIVFVAGFFNVKLNQEGVFTLATEIIGIIGSAIILWKRYKKGDITIFGAIKK